MPLDRAEWRLRTPPRTIRASAPQADTSGAVDYICKPFDPLMLRTKVGSFIELGRKRSVLQAEIHRRQQAEAELVRLNATLERQVEERTKALAAANQKLEQAARAKDQFLAMLAHELRNPLAPPLTLSERLLHSQHDSVAVRAASQVLERAVKHLVRLVDDLLDVTRIVTGKIKLEREPVALSAALEQAREQVRPWLDRHRFVATLPEEPLWLDGDPSRLTQVLSNLLHNAAKLTAGALALTDPVKEILRLHIHSVTQFETLVKTRKHGGTIRLLSSREKCVVLQRKQGMGYRYLLPPAGNSYIFKPPPAPADNRPFVARSV